jgi:hypothetical protein
MYVYDVPEEQSEQLLSPTDISSLDLYFNVSHLLSKALSQQRLTVVQFHDLIYIFGEVAYHCKNLAYEYCKITESFSKLPGELPRDETGETFAIVHNCNAHYEIDALITAIKRCFSIIRIVLWDIFCKKLGSVPEGEGEFFKKAGPYLPKELYSIIKDSWINWGEKAVEYRTFIQHYYTLTEHGWPIVHAKHLGNNIWCASLILPDNPEKKSRTEFTFENKIDALTYGWELTGLMESVFLQIAKSLSET